MSLQPVYILGFGSYLPEKVMSNEDWTQYVDTSDKWIESRTGIKNRRIAADNQSTVDLAYEASVRALENAKLKIEEVDEIIVATDTTEYTTPDTAAFLQHRLGARQISCYDLGGSGCAGFLQAMDIACSRIRTNKKNVLLIGVEICSRVLSKKDRTTCVLFGDGAGAFVIGEQKGQAEILGVKTGTDGSQTDILAIKVGGTKYPVTPENVANDEYKKLTMNGREVFRHAVSHMTESSQDLMTELQLSSQDIDLVVPHQANIRIIDAVGEKLGVDSSKVFSNIRELGNTASASIPIGIKQAIEEKRVKANSRVLFTSFGAGLHWASAMIRFTSDFS